MSAISDEPDRIKFVHTYGVGLHSDDPAADVHDPVWQKRQIDEFVDFAILAEELGFDGITVTEHHAPAMTCPSPHLLLAAAAVRTSRIRLGTAVTLLPHYHPLRVAEEAGTLDLLSGGRLELGLGKGIPGEALFAAGRELDAETANRGWLEAVELLHRLLTEKDVTFDGEFFSLPRATTIATRPLQADLPIWIGGASSSTMSLAGRYGWNILRNFGTDADHREALDVYREAAAANGHTRSGANMMIERFVAIGETETEAERNLRDLAATLQRFLALFSAGGRREIPKTDGEFLVEKESSTPNLAIAGTPDQIIDSLQRTIDETGARRILVETFTPEQARVLAQKVLPVLRERNAAPVLQHTRRRGGS